MKFDETYYSNDNYIHFKNISIEDKCAFTNCQMYITRYQTLEVLQHHVTYTALNSY